MSLRHLLSPLDQSEFLRTIWTKQAIKIAGEPGKFAHLFGWPALNEILSQEVDYATVKLKRDGRTVPIGEYAGAWDGSGRGPLDLRKLASLLGSGATLIINAVDRYLPPLRAYRSSLAISLGEICNANLYCSWPGSEGFGLHFDGHEVLAVQVAGEKCWDVFPATVSSPLRTPLVGRMGTPPAEQAPYLTASVRAGDIIYVPRGHWHRTRAVGGPSLHITFGIAGRTGLSLIEWLGRTLAEDPAWRESLPAAFGLATQDSDRILTRGRVAALISALTRQLQDPDLPALFIASEQHRTLGRTSTHADLPWQVDPEPWIIARSEFVVTDLGRLIRICGVDSVQKTFFSRELQAVEMAIIREVLDRETFGAAELSTGLPHKDWASVQRLLGDLVRCGAVRLIASC